MSLCKAEQFLFRLIWCFSLFSWIFCWVQAPVSFGGLTALSRVSYCSLLCFSSLLLGNFSFAQRVKPRLGCVRIFFSGFRRCFSWVDDWSPCTALGRAPQTPLETSPTFFYRVRLLSSKIILYLILPPEFQLSYRCYCFWYSTFLFETLWLDFFLCVCVSVTCLV